MTATKIVSGWPKFKAFKELMISMGVVGFFQKPVEIKPKVHSNFYVNWRTASSDAYQLDHVTDYIIDFIKFNKLNPKSIYGVPEASTKWAVVTQLKWAKEQIDFHMGKYPVPMGRGKIKDHGIETDRFFIGEPSGATIIIEDVPVDGGALLNSIDRLQSMKVNVIAAIVISDRNEKTADGKSVKQAVEERGVKYLAMSNALEFLPEVFGILKPGPEIAKAIEDEFNQHGTSKIQLGSKSHPFFALR